MKLVLASESPRRREILSSLGLKFEVAVPGIDEMKITCESPRDMALRLAGEKAAVVSLRIPNAWVIGADTVVDFEGEALSKPRDRADSFRMINMLNGKRHLVHTGVAVAIAGTVAESEAETTKVFFGKLLETEIEEFVSSGLGDDKAGAYAIQGSGALLVERIEGCFLNVVGLPVYRLKKILEKMTSGTFSELIRSLS